MKIRITTRKILFFCSLTSDRPSFPSPRSNHGGGHHLGVADVVYVLYQRLMAPPFMLLEIKDILATFGAFMAVLIAIEIFHNIILYVEDNHNQQLAVEIVLGTALMAIARKVIVLDFNEVGASHVYATAAVTLALSLGYYLIVIRAKGVKRRMSGSSLPSGNV